MKCLLYETDYPREETEFLVQGFSQGFSIGYAGPENRRDLSTNIPFSVGDRREMWNKLMTEVEASRITGPLDDIPFDTFIQSPIGLVPKANGKTRLIFHLSYNFAGNEDSRSLNYHMPAEICMVHYNDLDSAVMSCLRVSKEL